MVLIGSFIFAGNRRLRLALFPPVSSEAARTQFRKKTMQAPKGSKKRSRSDSTALPVKTEKHIKAERIKPEPVGIKPEPVEEELEELFFEEPEEEDEALPEDVSELIQEAQSVQGAQTRSRKTKP